MVHSQQQLYVVENKKDVSVLLSKAIELEGRIEECSAGPGRNEARGQSFRLKLCETMSDILLMDPAEACSNDVAGRLWRSCFYNRIGELRGLIAKESGRKQRRGGAASEVTNLAAGRKETLQRALSVFLEEAAVLYDFLIEKYEAMMNTKFQPHRSSPKARPSPHETNGGLKSAFARDPVVLVLHRLLIHRGDLFRYTPNYGKAEQSYQQSARLIPGNGNPYNQLAVISQQKEQTCLALYYYARSLCANGEPFGTSKANLGRLFVCNANWLKANQGKSELYKIIVAGNNKVSTSSNAQHGRLAKNGEKQLIVKLFLASYVGLHGTFFPEEKAAAGDKSSGNATNESLWGAPSVISQLQFVLSENCVSEPLLLKMIVINVFTVVYSFRNGKNRDVCSSALEFLFRFGTALIHRTESNVKTTIEKSARNASAADKSGDTEHGGKNDRKRMMRPNVGARISTALLLLCEWLRYGAPADILELASTSSAQGHRDLFYEKLASLWNVLMEHSRFARSLPHDAGTGTSSMSSVMEGSKLKEHLMLRGLALFDTFIPQEDERNWVSATGEEEVRTRLKRLHLCVSAQCAFDKDSGTYTLLCDEQQVDMEEQSSTQNESGLSLASHFLDETQPIVEAVNNVNLGAGDKNGKTTYTDVDDDADDVIVYKAPTVAAVPNFTVGVGVGEVVPVRKNTGSGDMVTNSVVRARNASADLGSPIRPPSTGSCNSGPPPGFDVGLNTGVSPKVDKPVAFSSHPSVHGVKSIGVPPLDVNMNGILAGVVPPSDSKISLQATNGSKSPSNISRPPPGFTNVTPTPPCGASVVRGGLESIGGTTICATAGSGLQVGRMFPPTKNPFSHYSISNDTMVMSNGAENACGGGNTWQFDSPSVLSGSFNGGSQGVGGGSYFDSVLFDYQSQNKMGHAAAQQKPSAVGMNATQPGLWGNSGNGALANKSLGHNGVGENNSRESEWLTRNPFFT